MNSVTRFLTLTLLGTCLLALLGATGCGPSSEIKRWRPAPIDEFTEAFHVDTELFRGGGLYMHSFSPDQNWLLLQGSISVPTNSSQAPYYTHDPGLILYRWPSLEEHWRLVLDDQTTHSLRNIHWTPTSDAIWLVWRANDHQITYIDLQGDSVTHMPITEGPTETDFVFSPDGTQMVAFGGSERFTRSQNTFFTPANYNHLYLYQVNGSQLQLEHELVLPEETMVTAVYWPTGEDWVWVSQIEAPCYDRNGTYTKPEELTSFPHPCRNPRSLYQWSLATDSYELYWEAFSVKTPPSYRFQSDIGYLIDDHSHEIGSWRMLDLTQRCTVLEWDFGPYHSPIWYSSTSISYLNSGYNRATVVGAYDIQPLVEGNMLPCLP